MTTCFFLIALPNVTFFPIGSGVLISPKSISFEERLSVLQETRVLLCVGNENRHNVKVQLVVPECSHEKVTTLFAPDTAVLDHGIAREFEVFIAPTCTCTLEDVIFLLTKSKADKPISRKIPFSFVTELSTRLPYHDIHDDAVCEKQTGERSLALSSLGNSGERRCDQEDEGVLL